ncbi:VWA domain-containing protein [Roseicyclus mahoneyensis]|uniref:Ca-activated chloride channel family protein n=1 Tax=Roseicyclus mahoneyensis TaxID=164332 RepID=A0A316GRJ9_9RHOB|nr:VWA domain-containing protein [Roseicyclus mahoneyensis]PWK62256.1 Ca-activated chloride channel family protein [Roseicyclus mahoneyensis]
MRAFLFALLTLALLPIAALAQQVDRPNTILVLDASGSMWGQIDGINKIVIARNVIAELLADLPEDTSLGLTVYGHRERGSCTDIETIVSPAPFTRDRILQAVNTINPRGRTPMTDAVVAAAQSLRYTEEAATVILVSDGIENCNPDPCAMARALEEAGVNFTAHVVGFDVAAEPEARAQMQCIAENTGGLFLTADNAAELSSALQQVVQAPIAETVTLQAVVVPGNTPPTRPITWTLLTQDGTVLSDGTPGPAITAQLVPGAYVARATRLEPTGPAAYQTAFTVVEGMAAPVLVPMPQIIDTVAVTFTARVEPDMTVPASPLRWTLFDASGATLLGPVDAPGGNVQLLPGDYRLSVERLSQGTVHEARFTVAAMTPQEVIIPLPALLVDVTFSARLDSADGVLITEPVIWEVTPMGDGGAIQPANPATVPLGRGAYRVTGYWTAQEVEQSADFVIVDQPREIVLVFEAPLPRATVTAPATAVAGSTIEVGWTGPNEQNDFIAVRAPDSEGFHRFVNSTRTDRGNPVQLLMPSEPGSYLVEYIRNDGRVALAAVPIEVTAVQASLTAPATAVAGSTIEVGWTGPDYQNDFISVRAPDSEGFHRFVNTIRTDRGNPARLQMPTEPGTYVIEYIEAQDRSPLAAVMIEISAVSASLTAPATAPAGATIEVGWTGPDYQNDFISVRAPDSEGFHRFVNTIRTDRGNPARLEMPSVPGTYVIEYIEAQDRSPLAAVMIEISAVSASVTAPATASIGSTIEVGWTGPDYNNDFIAIRAPDSEGFHRFEDSARTNRGNPARLEMPAEPGTYLIEYIEGQDRTPLAVAEITITQVEASLTAPANAMAGATIEVGWTGPGTDGDYIGIGRVGAQDGARWENYVWTREGNPARLEMPAEPGNYLITYFLSQDTTPLTSVPITITPVAASLTAPASAVAGQTIEVGWTGPDYPLDYIGIGRAGATDGAQWQNYTYTRDGSPLRLVVPTEPGDYVIRYFLNQEATSIAEVPLSVSAVAASITAPATAAAGSTVELGWTGPNYQSDFIGVGRAGATDGAQWERYTYTEAGNPLRLEMPDAPGQYVIRYFLGQGSTPIAEVPITLQ